MVAFAFGRRGGEVGRAAAGAISNDLMGLGGAAGMSEGQVRMLFWLRLGAAAGASEGKPRAAEVVVGVLAFGRRAGEVGWAAAGAI